MKEKITELLSIFSELGELSNKIEQTADLIVHAFRNGNKILLCGNGGSAAEAQHIAAEYVSSLRHEYKRKSLPAIALTTDSSFITSQSNDFGFESIFERQIESLGNPGDVLIAISTSGNSINIINGVRRAINNNLKVVGLTGKTGGQMKSLANILINIPSEKTMRIQECHLFVQHTICELVEEKLFPKHYKI